MTQQIWASMTSQPSTMTSSVQNWTLENSTQQPSAYYDVYQLHRPTVVLFDQHMTPLWYVIGFPGNALAICVWIQRRMRHSSGCYLAALALADFVFLVLQMLYEIHNVWKVSAGNAWCNHGIILCVSVAPPGILQSASVTPYLQQSLSVVPHTIQSLNSNPSLDPNRNSNHNAARNPNSTLTLSLNSTLTLTLSLTLTLIPTLNRPQSYILITLLSSSNTLCLTLTVAAHLWTLRRQFTCVKTCQMWLMNTCQLM